MEVMRRRRSVRKFEPGKSVSRGTLLMIAEAGRWAPSGANAQPWDFIIVDDPAMRDEVVQVFLRQANRLLEHARGFPAVMKSYLKNTVGIVLVIGDPRWKVCFPQGTDAEYEREYAENNENIFFCSLGAAIQNIQLSVTALGLTSAWLSGGGEAQTNAELAALLGYPPLLRAYGTIPIGYPARDVSFRYRRPIEQLVHWNGYDPSKFRRQAQIDFYAGRLRPFAMYRNDERMDAWDDIDDKLGEWKDAFTTGVTNPGGRFD
jgi:nitroreductase